jgi:hypothetical protein
MQKVDFRESPPSAPAMPGGQGTRVYPDGDAAFDSSPDPEGQPAVKGSFQLRGKQLVVHQPPARPHPDSQPGIPPHSQAKSRRFLNHQILA